MTSPKFWYAPMPCLSYLPDGFWSPVQRESTLNCIRSVFVSPNVIAPILPLPMGKQWLCQSVAGKVWKRVKSVLAASAGDWIAISIMQIVKQALVS